MTDPAIKTVASYLEAIDFIAARYAKNKSRGDLIFRGLSTYDHQLIPGLYRTHEIQTEEGPTRIGDFGDSEYTILRHFIKNAMSIVDHIHKDDLLTWLTYAQHFGAPTRLLDFSSNPLISLYFCCKREEGTDGAVAVLHERGYVHSLGLGEHGRPKGEILEEILQNVVDPARSCTRYPVTFIPHYIDNRMEAQGSRFLVWGRDKSSFEALAAPHGSLFSGSPEAFFAKIRVDGGSKRSLLRELSFLGVNEKKLFPGLDGIGRYIHDYYIS